jgi:hypothetical protein
MIGAILVPVSSSTLKSISSIISGEYWFETGTNDVEYRVLSNKLREIKDDIKGFFKDRELVTILSYNYDYVIFYV